MNFYYNIVQPSPYIDSSAISITRFAPKAASSCRFIYAPGIKGRFRGPFAKTVNWDICLVCKQKKRLKNSMLTNVVFQGSNLLDGDSNHVAAG